MKLEFSRQILEKDTNIKFHQNSSSGRGVVPCGRTDRQTDQQTDMTKLIATFRNFVNMPRNKHYVSEATSFRNIQKNVGDITNTLRIKILF
jgi:hypothetical protein